MKPEIKNIIMDMLSDAGIIPYFKPLKRRLTEVTAADIQKFYLVQLERVSANSVKSTITQSFTEQ